MPQRALFHLPADKASSAAHDITAMSLIPMAREANSILAATSVHLPEARLPRLGLTKPSRKLGHVFG
jgi:hypothetical protein